MIEPNISKCKQLFPGTKFAIKFVKNKIVYVGQKTNNLQEFKEEMMSEIDEFIMVKILYAQDIIIQNGLKIISDKREEVIMVYANNESQTIVDILKTAHDQGRKLRVVVVDSAPEYHGRDVVKRISKHGIKCQYTLINMASFLINQATKVFLAATYILCNGALVAPMGSSYIGCLAKQHKVPCVVVCESYKFEDRVNLDQISNNQQGQPHMFRENYLRKNGPNKEVLDEILKHNKNGKSK